MEAIGQKAVLSSTDEVIISDELGVDSGEMGEERMFDVTLDEILAEHPLDESLLEGLLEEDSLTASLASSILTQNQANPESVEDIFGTAELSTIPAEVLDDNLWTEETYTARSKVLNKSEPFTQELIEVLDPRVVSDENTFQNLPSQGVAETGLQSILQESDLENPESLLQTVFHQAKPPEEGAEFSEDDLQSVMQKNKNLPVQSKEDTEYSVLQKILHQVKPPEEGAEFSEDDLQTVLQTNTGQQIPIKENNSVVQGPEPVQENLEGLLQKELQTVFHQGLQGNEKDATKPVAENLVKIMPAEIPPAAEKISPEQSLQVVANTKTEKSLLAADNFKEAEEFEGGVKSKTTAGLQMTDVENLSDSAEKVSILPTEKLKAVESLKVVDNIKKSETLQTNTAEVLEGGAKEKTTAGLQTAEKFKVTEEFEGGVKEKATAGLQMNSAEKSKDISENAFKQPLNQFRSLTSKDTQLSSNVKSPVDSVSTPGINAVSELSGTLILKGTEVANSSNGNLRSADLPFNMEQVVSRVRILSGNGVEEMTLRLHPEELGQITLKIRQAGGNLTIDMRVDNMLAKQIVESGFDSLRSKFFDQEFSYKDLALNVDMNERDSKYGGDRKYAEFDEEMFSPERGNKEEISALEETPIVRHRTDSGLNLYV
ncbi:MAG: flagellar hook-length control protein FliK [SAR324 cluster bacterium]|nr:flagellar hook-length control protein FliK [SAR324 cluster bacterium]